MRCEAVQISTTRNLHSKPKFVRAVDPTSVQREGALVATMLGENSERNRVGAPLKGKREGPGGILPPGCE